MVQEICQTKQSRMRIMLLLLEGEFLRYVEISAISQHDVEAIENRSGPVYEDCKIRKAEERRLSGKS